MKPLLAGVQELARTETTRPDAYGPWRDDSSIFYGHLEWPYEHENHERAYASNYWVEMFFSLPNHSIVFSKVFRHDGGTHPSQRKPARIFANSSFCQQEPRNDLCIKLWIGVWITTMKQYRLARSPSPHISQPPKKGTKQVCHFGNSVLNSWKAS